MANAFGFVPPDTQPMGMSEQVGQTLMERRMAPEPAAPMVMPSSEMIRQAGGRYMGVSPTDNSAYNAAVGEALTRLGGGAMRNPNPLKGREEAFRQVRHLGLSEVEARLLLQAGGL